MGQPPGTTVWIVPLPQLNQASTDNIIWSLFFQTPPAFHVLSLPTPYVLLASKERIFPLICILEREPCAYPMQLWRFFCHCMCILITTPTSSSSSFSIWSYCHISPPLSSISMRISIPSMLQHMWQWAITEQELVHGNHLYNQLIHSSIIVTVLTLFLCLFQVH